MSKTPKVSVIIPVYNAEKYIGKCVRTLFEQTLDDIEYIFINDCTPDKSIEILNKVLEEYPKRKNQTKIIHHEKNKGIATSRNTGIKATTGTYVIHCDSDDWVEPNMYETMYNKAVEGDYDIVSCDYFIDNKNNSIYNNQLSCKNNDDYLKAVLTGKIGSYLWNKLTKKSIYSDNDLYFPDGINIREDFFLIIELYYFSRRVFHIQQAFYHYRKNETSITLQNLDKNVDLVNMRLEAMNLIEDFLIKNQALDKFESELNIAFLNLKHFILQNTVNKKKWINLYPDSKKYIKDLPYSLPSKIALYFASKNSIWGYNICSQIQKIGSMIKQFIISILNIKSNEEGNNIRHI